MGNIMAVKRSNYNDHGPVHAKIVAGSALELFELVSSNVEASSVLNGVCDYVGAELIVLTSTRNTKQFLLCFLALLKKYIFIIIYLIVS